MNNPYQVVADFEARLSDYTGAPHVVCVNSCTSAIMLAVAWLLRFGSERMADTRRKIANWAEPHEFGSASLAIEIPRKTYCSVPMAIIHAGGWPTFRDENWMGFYQLKPLPVFDSARWFSAGMWAELSYREVVDRNVVIPPPFVCVSFHASKTLGLEQGGAILHDNAKADAWLRRARFDGRTEGVAPKDDTFNQIGWHCYLNPSTAAQGILKLHSLPRHNDPLPNDEYPDLSAMRIFL